MLVAFVGLTLATGIMFLVRGGTRFVRIATAMLLLGTIGLWVASSGAAAALRSIAWTVGIMVAINFVVLRQWRSSLRRRFEPLQTGVWPATLEDDLARWTRELQALGFVVCGDLQAPWKLGSEDRKMALRFFRHEQEPVWASISANRKPKGIGRCLQSKLTDGRFVLTSDRQVNEAVLPDPKFVVRRGNERDGCDRLLAHHRKVIEECGSAPVPIADPATAEKEQHDAWADAVIASGQAFVDGEWIALKPLGILRAMARTYAAWFA